MNGALLGSNPASSRQRGESIWDGLLKSRDSTRRSRATLGPELGKAIARAVMWADAATGRVRLHAAAPQDHDGKRAGHDGNVLQRRLVPDVLQVVAHLAADVVHRCV